MPNPTPIGSGVVEVPEWPVSLGTAWRWRPPVGDLAAWQSWPSTTDSNHSNATPWARFSGVRLDAVVGQHAGGTPVQSRRHRHRPLSLIATPMTALIPGISF
jgi:hypothetical protein